MRGIAAFCSFVVLYAYLGLPWLTTNYSEILSEATGMPDEAFDVDQELTGADISENADSFIAANNAGITNFLSEQQLRFLGAVPSIAIITLIGVAFNKNPRRWFWLLVMLTSGSGLASLNIALFGIPEWAIAEGAMVTGLAQFGTAFAGFVGLIYGRKQVEQPEPQIIIQQAPAPAPPPADLQTILHDLRQMAIQNVTMPQYATVAPQQFQSLVFQAEHLGWVLVNSAPLNNGYIRCIFERQRVQQ